MLSISIVTYNCRHTIGKTIESILLNLPPESSTRLIVIDNRSSDGTLDVLRAFAANGSIELISNSQNLGFGQAHNQALALADSRYHVICNPDIVVSEGLFTHLTDYMENHPAVGIVCPRFHYEDGTIQPLNRRNPTVLDLFLRRFLPVRLRPYFRKRLDAYEMRDVGYEVACDVPFMTGAFMFCRTDVLKAVGGFDERFFLYFEDADLSRKVQGKGFQTVFYPEVNLIHVWERMAHRNWHMAWVFSTSAFRYFRKWGWRLW